MSADMANNAEAHSSIYVESSSDDECLSVVKRKVESIKEENDSEDDHIMAGVLVTVEVQEMEDACPLEFNKNAKIKKKKKKKLEPIKIKKNRTFPCPECSVEFETAGALKKHSLEHQVKTRHKCEVCGRYFKKSFSLRMHSRVHMEKKAPQCPLCGLNFNHKNYLSRHMTRAHERTEECKSCHVKFHTKNQLINHRKQAHSKRNPQYIAERNLQVAAGNDQHGAVSSIPLNLSHTSTNHSSETEHADNTESLDNTEQGDNTSDKEDDSGPLLPFMFSEYNASQKREDLSHPTQCAIVSKMHKGRSVQDVCRLYNLTPEIVNEIWEDREKYALPKKVAKRTTRYMNSVLDTRIVEWFHAQRANDIQVSGKNLQDIAEAFAKESGFVAFNGSKKWLDRFKKRYNISLRGIPRKRDYSNHNNDSKWKNHFFNEQWSDARLGISDEDIYTADEFGFYYNPSKGRIKKLAGKKYIQGHVKDRLAVFLCANMPGTDKRKLLVCGTEDPLIHSYRDPDTLPVTYIRHSQAHFTTQMFEEYVKYWNRELQSKDRKAILVLDRATIHSKLQLSHLKLVFVPWKATNGLIPMKNGVSAKFREEFRRLILEEKSMNVIRGVDRDLTCLEALYMLEKAWERTPAETITKSFVDTGYDVTVPEEFVQVEKPKIYDNDEEVLCNMLKEYDIESYFTNVASLDQYLTVDEELVTGQGTNGSVFGGNHKVIEPVNQVEKEKEDLLPLATEKPDSEDKEALVKKSRALQDLDIIKKYLHSNVTSYDTFCCFMEVENFVMRTVMG